MTSARARLFSLASAAGVFALDRLTKWIIESRVETWQTYKVIPGFFDIVHTQNKGVAFGLGNDNPGEWQSYFLVVLSLLIFAFLLWMIWKATSEAAREHWSLVLGLSLVLGGAAGNLFDRAIFGSVTDFLDFYIGTAHWPVFNLADSGISVGAVLLILNIWKARNPAAAPTESR